MPRCALEGGPQQLGLRLAQQPVVDEDAGQLVADGPMHQRGRHRRVDAARQRADDLLDRPRVRRPAAGCRPPSSRRSWPASRTGVAAGDVEHEVAQESRPRGVCATSGWNWMPYSRRVGVAQAGERRCVGLGASAGSRPAARVIESPWLIQTGWSRPMPRNRPSSAVILTGGRAVLALVGRARPRRRARGPSAAPVADAEHRDAPGPDGAGLASARRRHRPMTGRRTG